MFLDYQTKNYHFIFVQPFFQFKSENLIIKFKSYHHLMTDKTADTKEKVIVLILRLDNIYFLTGRTEGSRSRKD